MVEKKNGNFQCVCVFLHLAEIPFISGLEI